MASKVHDLFTPGTQLKFGKAGDGKYGVKRINSNDRKRSPKQKSNPVNPFTKVKL